MEDILFAALGLLPQTIIKADLIPIGEPFRFLLGQASPHRKIGLGKEKRVAVIAFRIVFCGGHVYLEKGVEGQALLSRYVFNVPGR